MKLPNALLCLAAVPVLAWGTESLVESRAYYSTNPSDAVGRTATINIDGQFDDWTEDMIIATCGANDMATAFKGSHENCVLDCYALYAAWDDNNLYMAWQMCNSGDTWAREGDGPLTDYGRIGDVPLILAISVDPTSRGMNGMLQNGNFIWGDNSSNGVKFTSHVDHLFFMSGKAGQGTPAMFTRVDDYGNTNYDAGCTTFSNAGIAYAMKEGFHPSHYWRQRTTAEWLSPTELVSDPSIINNIYDAENYDNLMEQPIDGLKTHDFSYDSFYEIKIPLRALGITREWLENNGIGARLVATRGESGIDCIPFDPSMVDNTFGEYGKDESTTHEKDDIDEITYDLASVAKIRDLSHIDPLPDPEPDPEPDDPTDGDYVVYFKDNVTPAWTSVKTWIWDAGNGNKNYTGGSWPGAAMTATTYDDTTGYWVYSFSTEDSLSQPMIIFNNGGSEQTGDLVFYNYGIYDRTGKIGTAKSGVQSAYANDAMAPVEYYSLQGIRISEPAAGQLVIRRQGSKVVKIKL
ncbi:MAG: starch-binding protein [Bacteroidales bacterium]|nr:starch-binding protein [Bacteroidales bacterium]MCD8394764.1 starch-binding protein [Bacteroidales bacterium]